MVSKYSDAAAVIFLLSWLGFDETVVVVIGICYNGDVARVKETQKPLIPIPKLNFYNCSSD